MPMLRYAVLGMIGLVTSGALAQQAPPQADAPGSSSPPASVHPSKAVIPMEEPLPGDYWTYEIRDDITGTISGPRTNVVTEVTPTEISVHSKISATSNEGFSIYDRSWNLISSGP